MLTWLHHTVSADVPAASVLRISHFPTSQRCSVEGRLSTVNASSCSGNQAVMIWRQKAWSFTEGPKVCQENLLHTSQNINTRQDPWFHEVYSKLWPTLIYQSRAFLHLLVFSFVSVEWHQCVLLLLEPCVCFCCSSLLALRYRDTPLQTGCNEWLSEVSSPLWGILSQRAATRWIFSLFQTILWTGK